MSQPTVPLQVTQVETAIPVFIGYTEKSLDKDNKDLHLVAMKIKSLTEYSELFGGAAELKSTVDEVSASHTSSTGPNPNSFFLLFYSLKLFFDNGGGPCYIISIGNCNGGIQKNDFIEGLESARKVDEINLLAFPEAVNLPGNDLYEVQQKALKDAGELRDRFCILDLKIAESSQAQDLVVSEFRNNIGTEYLSYGAAYSPALRLSTIPMPLPASAAVAAVYARVDKSRGVWKASANEAISNISGLTYYINTSQQQSMNIDAVNGKSVNPIRKVEGKGFLIWGARTLAGNDNEWKYVPVRRFFLMVEESVKKSTEWAKFEPNDAGTWSKLKTMIENYLLQLWRQGALMGIKPEQAYFVHIGLNQTMTAQDINDGRMIIEIGMAPVRPGEFIILRFPMSVQAR